MKLGDKVRLKSKHHQKKVFEVTFIEGEKITCFYNPPIAKNAYRVITTKDRIKSIEK